MEQTKIDLLLSELMERQYKLGYTPADEQKLLTIQGKTIGLQQSFVIYSGLPKSCKSTYLGATIGSAFTDTDIFGIKLHLKQDECIGLFDTESSEWDFYKSIERIKKFAGINDIPANLFAYQLREDNPQKIKVLISIFLQNNPNCKVVIIDGLLDCLIDYNDVKESRELIQYLKLITKKYNILVIAVLHLGKKDQNTLGHLGSLTDRYANSVLKIEKSKEQQAYLLTPTFLRSSNDFETIGIKWFEHSNQFEQIGIEQPAKKESLQNDKTYDWKRFLVTFMKSNGMTYKELVDDLKESQGVGINIAKQIVKKWIAEQLIYKRNNLYYH